MEGTPQHSRFFYHINPELGKQPASYGLTLEGLIDLQEKQQRGTQPMVPCSEEPSIEIQASEAEFVYLLAMENPLFDSKIGNRIDRGVTFQKYNIAAFAAIEKGNFPIAQKVVIIHSPIRYMERKMAEATKDQEPIDEKEQEALLKAELAKDEKKKGNGK